MSWTIRTILERNASDWDARPEVRAEVWSGWLARDPEEALAHFSRALQLDPDCEPAVRGIAWARRRLASNASAPSEEGGALAAPVVRIDRDGPKPVSALAAAVARIKRLPMQAAAPAVSPAPAAASRLAPRPARPPASPLPPASPPKRFERPSDVANPNFWVPVAYLVAIA